MPTMKKNTDTHATLLHCLRFSFLMEKAISLAKLQHSFKVKSKAKKWFAIFYVAYRSSKSDSNATKKN